MKRMMSLLATLSIAIFSAPASALEVDFTARITNFNDSFTVTPRLVSVVAFDQANLSGRGFVTVSYRVTNVFTETQMFAGSATIVNGQTEVATGNARTGKITLTYDAALDRVEARFVLNLALASDSYEIEVSDEPGYYRGLARVQSYFIF